MTEMKNMPRTPGESDCKFIRDNKIIVNECFQKIFSNNSLAYHTVSPLSEDTVRQIFEDDKVPYAIIRRWKEGNTVWFAHGANVERHIANAENPQLFVVDGSFVVVSDYPERPGDLMVCKF